MLFLIMMYACTSNHNPAEDSTVPQTAICDTLTVFDTNQIYDSKAKQIDTIRIQSDSVNCNEIKTVSLKGYYGEKDDIDRFISTPYGLIRVTDYNPPLNFYVWLTEKSGNYRIDSINTLILMEIGINSDGGLSELLGNYYKNDFLNKTDIVLNIYRHGNTELVENYLELLGYELDSRMIESYIAQISSRSSVEDNDSILTKAVDIIRENCYMEK